MHFVYFWSNLMPFLIRWPTNYTSDRADIPDMRAKYMSWLFYFLLFEVFPGGRDSELSQVWLCLSWQQRGEWVCWKTTNSCFSAFCFCVCLFVCLFVCLLSLFVCLLCLLWRKQWLREWVRGKTINSFLFTFFAFACFSWRQQRWLKWVIECVERQRQLGAAAVGAGAAFVYLPPPTYLPSLNQTLLSELNLGSFVAPRSIASNGF